MDRPLFEFRAFTQQRRLAELEATSILLKFQRDFALFHSYCFSDLCAVAWRDMSFDQSSRKRSIELEQELNSSVLEVGALFEKLWVANQTVEQLLHEREVHKIGSSTMSSGGCPPTREEQRRTRCSSGAKKLLPSPKKQNGAPVKVMHLGLERRVATTPKIEKERWKSRPVVAHRPAVGRPHSTSPSRKDKTANRPFNMSSSTYQHRQRSIVVVEETQSPPPLLPDRSPPYRTEGWGELPWFPV